MLAFVRHGEPRTGEVDPALTSWGHRAASEAGAWLARAGLLPTIIWHTPARRARETAEALAMHLPATTRAIARLPEDDASWAVLLRQLGEHPGDAAIVGHHPTQDYLEVRFGPAPTPIPRNNRAAVLVLEGEPWRIVASWPGRPS